MDAKSRSRSDQPGPRKVLGQGYCACPIDTAFEVIGKKWALLLLRNMMLGQRRFNEFLSSIPGLNPKVLSQRLKELEQERLVDRRVADARPLTVEYFLTQKGYSIFPVLRSMARWSLQWAPEKIFGDGHAPQNIEACLEEWQRGLLEAREDLVVERRDEVVDVLPKRRPSTI